MKEFIPQWGSWFAGFVAGNGRFSINKGNEDNPRDNYRCKFELGCPPRDRHILDEVHDTLELGSIIEEPVTLKGDYTGRFQTRLQVDIIEECAEIVQVFEQYPLRTQKQASFDIWKEAVREQSKPLDDRDPLMLDWRFTMLPRAEQSEDETSKQEEKPTAPEQDAKPTVIRKSMQLYAITDAILNQYTDKDDIDPSIEELEKWDAAFDHKIGACAAVVKNLTAEVTAYKEEAAILNEKARTTTNKADALKEYMKRNMEFVDKKSVTAGVFKVRIQKSPMSIKVQDADRIPEKFKWEFKEWRIDKKAIADHVKETGEIPDGVESHQNTHLRIT